ncbi:FAD-dependent oxidoreductase [Pseudomonas faucium]|uniref:FAD-dependent oxidoreductase n=1 Tax=Pseudomonas faucium TaxID=2740518 RepID=UPI0039C34C2B
MIRWDECCDVLVIGAGAGGMTAALRAHDLGLDTLLIEKRERYGGRSAATAGVVCIPGQGRAMLEYLERDTRVRFTSLEPQPFAGAALGEELLHLRAPSPDTLMIGRMAMTLDEARVLQGRGRGWAHLVMKVLWRSGVTSKVASCRAVTVFSPRAAPWPAPCVARCSTGACRCG